MLCSMLAFVPNDHLKEFVQAVFPARRVSMRPLLSGLLNQNLVVRVGSERYVLKAYRPKVSLKAMREMHRMMAHAVGKGIPVPLPVASGEVGGHAVALYPFVEGTHPSRYRNAPLMRPMGEMLGRIDATLETFKFRMQKPAFEDMASWNPESFLSEIVSMRRSLRSKPKVVRETVARSLDAHENAVAIGGWDKEAFRRLPVRVCHNDYHIMNVLVRGRKVAAVLDWEKAGWGWRGFEVMRSVMFNCRMARGTLDWDRVKTYLGAYRKQAALTDLERELAFECGFRKGLFSLWAEKEYLSGQFQMRDNIERRSRLYPYLAKHRDEFSERVAELLR
ncbi:hypothetical protein EPO34_04590 [Patescibacteria group bacterium]|nr:MAG: hypothetical protein EPO34_04590 [Patescibacteria group bacterium]